MPLRDHFRPPVFASHSPESFFCGWPAVMVQQLRRQLPPGYVAAPYIGCGSPVETDPPTIVTVDENVEDGPAAGWALSVDVETDVFDALESEVRIYDVRHGRRLVAAVEFVSPANKDRPAHRSLFATKCAALLRQGVAVSVVDVVTPRHFNLYLDLLGVVGHTDDTLGEPPPHLYAASCRWTERGVRKWLEAVSHPLVLGQPLPTLPLWLGRGPTLPLDLEPSYEQTCHDLWIT